ncbi:hypothetical protein DCCM_4568 [Desulfocucumis palustris]|uniref:Uncharacterized protein n=1 Tax=Desulfocucumis palustris TaxID=1898651 RepID=A0A2L2XNA3_9FIRM|nr:hypothetical protein DCCM_4568 [Desulfocucumis palustris]
MALIFYHTIKFMSLNIIKTWQHNFEIFKRRPLILLSF